VGLIVRSHHERWDGRGYPDGLAGEEIPLEARIIACCDTWNAMRTDRSYRRSIPFEVAIAELESISGSQLDPRIARTLIEVVQPKALEHSAQTDDPRTDGPTRGIEDAHAPGTVERRLGQPVSKD
jgi:HD-GYP domain-containing protein (c-di-GMP phosphodiesterase class II)